MQTLSFNDNWQCRRIGTDEWQTVSIPHDAMLGEERSFDSEGGTNTGWCVARDYEYKKCFFVPCELNGKKIVFEFEGVYKDAEVYINGTKACYRPYGYTNFYVDATSLLTYGADNEILLKVKNSDQPNSRWYSGTGIYRPVHMHVLNEKSVLLNGVKIKTLSVSPATIQVRIKTSCAGQVALKIKDGDTVVASAQGDSDGEISFNLQIPSAKLWTSETPFLYVASISFFGDEIVEEFGVRTVSCSAKDGFCLNGKRVIIRGACIHHDNGILGARCFEEAEQRKIALLKKAGYNAIRSAHNPCSKALLRACDKQGMMVMDEYTDMWYIHKTRFDYATHVEKWYEQDVKDMVDKDFNHPCVIMYSFGNEVAETGQKKGIEFFKKMRDCCKALDDGRPITVGVNIFFNYLHSLGFGVYSDEKAVKNPQKKVGSEFFNTLACHFGAGFMKTMAMLPGCDKKTRDCYAEMDVAGYNYGIKRYKKDVKKYPNRIILGSETFCADAYQFFEMAKRTTAIIGDFVWAGMDYLGEVGIGAWEYRDYAPEFTHGVGWVSAGSGRIDLIGNFTGEALYTQVVFEQEDKPQIAVVPVNNTGKAHSPSSWKFSNALPSWSWNGQDGKRAIVEVYSRAPKIELYINGKKVGVKKFKKNCRFVFKTKYMGGEITAVALDKNGVEISRNSLYTANENTQISIKPEVEKATCGQIVFVHLQYTDDEGTVKPLERGIISVSVDGGEILATGNACPYNKLGYLSHKTDTYYGCAMTVIKVGDADKLKIYATDGTRECSKEIEVER